jgi:hypothetical protein
MTQRKELPPMVDYIIPNGTSVIAYAVSYFAEERHPCCGIVESFIGSTYTVRLDPPWHGQAIGYFNRNRVRPINALERLVKEI